MRLFTRTRLIIITAVACLFLLVVLATNAFAFTVNPHISVTPHHVVTDVNMCANVHLSGSGFTESTASLTNTAHEHIFDNNSPNEAYFAQTGTNTIDIPVNKEGKFSTTLTICDHETIFAGVTFTISGFDSFTGLANNSVQVRAD